MIPLLKIRKWIKDGGIEVVSTHKKESIYSIIQVDGDVVHFISSAKLNNSLLFQEHAEKIAKELNNLSRWSNAIANLPKVVFFLFLGHWGLELVDASRATSTFNYTYLTNTFGKTDLILLIVNFVLQLLKSILFRS